MRIFKFVWFSLLFVLLDQLTKYIFFDLSSWSDLLLLTPSFNTWIARSIPFHMVFVIVLSVLFLIYFVWAFVKSYYGLVVSILIISGTIWNLIDRVALFWVRDFIDFKFFPIFNFADIYLSVWVFFLIYSVFVTKKDWQHEEKM